MSASDFTGQRPAQFPEDCQETWTLVNDAVLWESGLARAVWPVGTPDGPQGMMLIIYGSREQATRVIEEIGLTGAKPLRLGTLVLLGLLEELAVMGMTHLARWKPETGFDCTEIVSLLTSYDSARITSDKEIS